MERVAVVVVVVVVDILTRQARTAEFSARGFSSPRVEARIRRCGNKAQTVGTFPGRVNSRQRLPFHHHSFPLARCCDAQALQVIA